MNHEEYLLLVSEIDELESILRDIPAERVVDRRGFETRLNNAKGALTRLNPDFLPKKARLTFRGSPVFGSHGIAAEFANKASICFTDAFAAIMAGISENLRYMGPIPDKQKNQLIITGTAIGSFGFEYELPVSPVKDDPSQSQLILGVPQKPETAMQKIEALFRIASEGNDDELSDIIEEIHPRAVKKVADFLDYLSDQQAWCGLEFDSSAFRFSDSDQVKDAAERLNSDNIKESVEEFSGQLTGALPDGRTFEFKLGDQNSVLRGKLGPAIEDPNVINRKYLYKPVTITLSVVQVGQGRPRYTLARLDDIQGADQISPSSLD